MSKAAQSSLTTAHLSDGSMICSGRVQMVIPDGGAHTRFAEIWTPRFDLEASEPVVTATVYAPGSAGPFFAVYNINVNPAGDLTQIAVTAQNIQLGVESTLRFYCNIIVCGKPYQRPETMAGPGRAGKKAR